jgi:CBS domain containing-hemolysin-like protein
MESITWSLVAVSLLLAANGFFVAAEFALVKARGYRLETRAVGGDAAARLTLRIQGELEAYLAACQLGITMASLGLGWVGEPAVAALLEPLFRTLGLSDRALHTVSFVLGFLLFSSLHIVLGEQVPKTFAIRKAEPVSLLVAYPLQIAYLVTYPLNRMLSGATSAVLGLMRVEKVSHTDVLTGEELKGLVATSGEHGEIGPQKAAMLKNLFEFDQQPVGRVMIPRGSVTALDVTADPADNLALIRDSGHSRFPVIDGERDNQVLGVIIAKDLHNAVLSGEAEPWRHLERYWRPPLIVPEGRKVSRLFETMRAARAHMAVVTDEYAALAGIVTLEDLLEEIVGEIEDETDVDEAPLVRPVSPGLWEADGLAPLVDLERVTGLEAPDGLAANTLSGLCMARLGRMPEAGDRVSEGPFVITVLGRRENRVDRAEVRRLDEPDDAGGSSPSGRGGER